MHLLRGPTEQQMDMICAELNENSERFDHTINLLQKWIAYQPHLPKNIDEKIIPVFLRGCKHDIERTKRKIELYYSVRKSCPELYTNRDPTASDVLTAARMMNVVPLPTLTKDGSRITINKLMSNDCTYFDIESVVKYVVMMGDIRVHTETPISGDIYIMDLAHNLAIGHCAKAANTFLRKAFTIATEAYPQRIKRIHVINTSPIVDKFLAIMKSFMKEKLRERFVVHSTLDTLFDYVPAELLPNEYGGSAGELSEMHENWQKILVDRKKWFQEQEGIVAVGPIPRHLSHSCALDSTDGIQGSFRALAID